MDRQMQERLQVYEREALASPKIVKFVHAVLLWLEQVSQHECTEETAGPLASHLMLALARVERGEQLGNTWSQEVHDEAMTLTSLLPWVEQIRYKARHQLALTLPSEEIDFLLLHLGTFLLGYNDDRRVPLVQD
ncbi:MAG TPA: hypothetical protein VH593_12315 [Ktedonobacteraceae bacterium]